MKDSKTKSPLRGIAISILGRPGSGKDTQAELLAKKFGLVHIISSKVIKKALESPKSSFKLEGKIYNIEKERRLQSGGALNTPAFVSALVRSEIKSTARRGKGIIMSGSLRTLRELKDELPLLNKLYGKNVHIFNVKIGAQEVYVRNLKRRRKDLPELDTKKIIKKRLAIFNSETAPVIKLLKKQKMIFDINGEQPITKIHQDILKILKSKWQLQSKQKKK
ncbi:MAG: nucleoside monophosphate kinase [Candidatus Azambacteria bacterium]|nr:nucleoside monophosphate kinase [Candidatus Azambacteria bacterium]